MRTAFGVVALALALAFDAYAQTAPAPPSSPTTPTQPPTTPPPAATPPAPPAITAPPAGPTGSAPTAPQILGRKLALDEAVAIALAGQPQIQARLFDYAAARHRVTQALAPMLPQLTGSVTATRSQQTTLSTSATTGLTTPVQINRDLNQTLFAQVALSQLLFDFGKTLAATDAARKLATVALESVELQRQLISLAVKEAYTNINFSQRLITVAQAQFDRAQLNLRSARGFYEVGTRPKSDVVRAEVDVANARVDLIRGRNAERLARVALNTAMGIDVDTPTQVQENLIYEPVQFDRPQLRAEALRQRPEHRQAKLQVDVTEAQERLAFRNFLPNLFGTGAYGGTRSELNPFWSLGLSLTWTIFDGGNLVGKYQEARANLDAAQSRVKASALDIIQNVEQAEIVAEESQERIQAAQAAVASAEENFRLAQGRFDAGVGTILELTDAQLALTQSQNVEAQALADFRIALSRLDRALGRR
jgi:outer membrane protein TolC